MANKIFNEDIKVINVGLSSFREDLEEQDVKVVQVDWTIPNINENTKRLLNLLLEDEED